MQETGRQQSTITEVERWRVGDHRSSGAGKKPSRTQETNENLDDAGNELILSDEDVVRFQIGEVFAHMPRDDVETKLEQMKEDAAKRLERLEGEKESILAQMAELKKVLYGKFKDAINLEED
ncbi:hypothetical protein GUJ93_ZPchr0003g18142 [Zizania palustris]|uniref:Prefoldin subunit 4 n=1 Tax=Zizania palustris TaxID=103762 RepID=A0A8J5SBS6_ZIZPA|nr:hypothetical protein GUJ93_ZPchr0003g18142 [Zizania palustris]